MATAHGGPITTQPPPLQRTACAEALHQGYRLNRFYDTSAQTARMLVRATSQEDLFGEACRIAVDHGLVRMAWIGLFDTDARTLRPVAAHGHVAGYLDQIHVAVDDVAEGRGPSGTAFRGGQSVVVDDIGVDDRFIPWREAALARGYRSVAAFPLRLRGEVVGIYSLYSAEAGWFGETEVGVLEALVADIAFTLELLEREHDRTRAEERLLRERALSEAILDGLPGVLYVVDGDGRMLRWNRRLEEVLGLTRDELRGRNAMRLCCEAQRDDTPCLLARAYAAGRSEGEVTLVSATGQEQPYFFTIVGFESGGRRLLVGVGIDISARLQAESSRQSTERLLSDIVESSGDAIFGRALDGSILSWNMAAERMYGYTAAEAIGDPLLSLVPSDRVEELGAAIVRAANGEFVPPFETQRRRKDGTLIDVSLCASPLRDSAGHLIGASMIARDISQWKRDQEQLRRLRAEVEIERMRTFRATMTTVHDIVNNFLNNLQWIRLEAEDRLASSTLETFDEMIAGTASELRKLGALKILREKDMAIGTGIDY